MCDFKFKLTDENLETRNNTRWRIGQTIHATGDPNQDLCSDGWLHCYDSPELAVLLNPIHANIREPRMLVVKCEGDYKTNLGLKTGYRSMTPVLYMDCPAVTLEQRICFAILCAKQVRRDWGWNAWADGWLSGVDRSAVASYAAASAAAYKASAAARAAHAAALAANIYTANVDASVDAASYIAADAARAAAYDTNLLLLAQQVLED